MPKRIQKILISNFRGATSQVDLDFDPAKNTILLFGENGSGKSTITDAIDFVCNGNFGSIKDRSSVRPNKHLQSLNAPMTSLKVSMVFDDKKWDATFDGTQAKIIGPAQRPLARILRRSSILALVTEEPRDRYKSLKAFIEVPGMEKCESALREAVKNTEKKLEEATRAVEQSERDLQLLWEAEGKPGKTALSWAKSETAKDISDLNTSLTNITATILSLECLSSPIITLTEAQLSLASAKKELDDINKKAEETDKKEARIERDVPLVEILQKTQDYLNVHPQLEKCLVCEQIVPASQLIQQLKVRLETMKEVADLKKDIEQAEKSIVLSEAKLVDACAALKEKIIAVLDFCQKSSISVIKNNGDWVSLQSEEKTIDSKNPNAVKKFAEKIKIQVSKCADTLELEKSSVQKSINHMNAIRNHVRSITENKESLTDLHEQAKRLKEILKVVETQRKFYVEEILNSISKTVDEIYKKVHPDEGLGGLSFFLKATTQGSLEFTGKFQNATDIPPQAYYSESHLDTLGISVFLALARYFEDQNSIVVLDDVITSVDEAHTTRLMQMFHDEAAHFNQLIITTHFKPWRNRYCYSLGPVGHIQLIELLPWNILRGITHTKTKICVDDLRAKLQEEPLQRQHLSSQSGILLECILDHLALMYGCKLPRKPEIQYTLGELLGGIDSKLRKALKTSVIDSVLKTPIKETALEPVILKINEITWVRNMVGCHWNIAGLGISDQDVKDLVHATLELADLLICPECGELPRGKKEGIYRKCSCGARRLLPLEMPV